MPDYIKSPMNYTGGKYKILEHIIPSFPAEMNNFVDLFAGGLNVGINVQATTIYANDQITYLVELYRMFQDTPTDSLLKQIKDRIAYYGLSQTNADGYNALRAEYNRSRSLLDLFVLTCYSFNHQIRFNSKHEFNTPFGKERSSFNDSIERNLILFCNALHKKNIILSTSDFRGFKDWTTAEDSDLLTLLDRLHEQGILFALSNVFAHKGQTNDALIEWSKKYNVLYIDKTYANCSYHFKDRGTKTVEVLITNYDWEGPKCEQMTLVL